MNVPKEVKDIIKKIEEIGLDLAKYEKLLYDWLDTNKIEYDYRGNNDTSIDTDLNILFQNHSGDALLESLEKYRKESK